MVGPGVGPGGGENGASFSCVGVESAISSSLSPAAPLPLNTVNLFPPPNALDPVVIGAGAANRLPDEA